MGWSQHGLYHENPAKIIFTGIQSHYGSASADHDALSVSPREFLFTLLASLAESVPVILVVNVCPRKSTHPSPWKLLDLEGGQKGDAASVGTGGDRDITDIIIN